jgi:hypothetical protein
MLRRTTNRNPLFPGLKEKAGSDFIPWHGYLSWPQPKIHLSGLSVIRPLISHWPFLVGVGTVLNLNKLMWISVIIVPENPPIVRI